MADNNSQNKLTRKQKLMQKKERIKERAKSSTFIDDFKSFAFKGNVIDLAVGLIIGTSFNKIVSSLANDIIMPPVGKVLGNAAFKDLFINLADEPYSTLASAEAAGAPIIKYGLFITNIIDFIVVALTLFVVLRYVLKVKKEEEKK